jgi:hypothetical protein
VSSDDKTIKMRSPFEEEVLGELRTLASRLTSLEATIAKIDWDSFRRDFVKHNLDVRELIGDLDRKFDVINHDLLQVKAEQIRIEKRIDKMETDARPQVIVQDRQF